MSEKDIEGEYSPIDTPSGGGINEDWLATAVGLALLALALLGIFKAEWVIW